jgi:hypothetical protein
MRASRTRNSTPETCPSGRKPTDLRRWRSPRTAPAHPICQASAVNLSHEGGTKLTETWLLMLRQPPQRRDLNTGASGWPSPAIVPERSSLALVENMIPVGDSESDWRLMSLSLADSGENSEDCKPRKMIPPEASSSQQS